METADSEETRALALLHHLTSSEATDQEVLTPPTTPGAAPHPPGAQPGEQEVLGHRQVNQQTKQFKTRDRGKFSASTAA